MTFSTWIDFFMIDALLQTEFRQTISAAYLVTKVLSHGLPVTAIAAAVGASEQGLALAERALAEIEMREQSSISSLSAQVRNRYIAEIDVCLGQRTRREIPRREADTAAAMSRLALVPVPLS